jgi:hypothetical protein
VYNHIKNHSFAKQKVKRQRHRIKKSSRVAFLTSILNFHVRFEQATHLWLSTLWWIKRYSLSAVSPLSRRHLRQQRCDRPCRTTYSVPEIRTTHPDPLWTSRDATPLLRPVQDRRRASTSPRSSSGHHTHASPKFLPSIAPCLHLRRRAMLEAAHRELEWRGGGAI